MYVRTSEGLNRENSLMVGGAMLGDDPATQRARGLTSAEADEAKKIAE